jgi:hypothetical protein
MSPTPRFLETGKGSFFGELAYEGHRASLPPAVASTLSAGKTIL